MKSWLQTVLPALFAWAVPGLIWAQDRPYEWGWGMHPMMWGAWGFGMMFMMVLFWVLVIMEIVLAIRWLTSQGREQAVRFGSGNLAAALCARRDRQGRVRSQE